MTFNLIQLQTFHRLAGEGSYTRTAELLHVTQPAVTQHVRALQEHFSVQLVDLVGRRTVLTEAGRFLAARAELLLGNVAALEREMREFADVRAGELRIGATVSIGTYTLPALVAQFRVQHAAIKLRVEVANTREIALAVKAGRISLALVEGPLADDDLDIRAYADDELILIAAPGHRFVGRRRAVKARELEAIPFVSREEGSGTRTQVQAALSALNVVPDIVLTLPTGEGIVRAVELGVGVAIVSKLVAAAPLRDGRVNAVPLHDLSFRRTLRVARLRRQTPSPAALAFAALLNLPEV